MLSFRHHCKLSMPVHDYVVCGGPCICFAKGDPLRLTLQDLIDCLMPCLAALAQDAPCLLFFQSYESDLMADVLHYDVQEANFARMKANLLQGVRTTLALMGRPTPFRLWVFDTQEPSLRRAVDQGVSATKHVLHDEHLFGLYSKVSNSAYPRATTEERLMLHVYRRNMVLYRRETLLCCPEFPRAEHLLCIENTTQQRAVQLATDVLDPKVQYRGFDPAPNKQGKEMNLGNRNHKVELGLTARQVQRRCAELEASSPAARSYYRGVFGGLHLGEIMTAWQRAVEQA